MQAAFRHSHSVASANQGRTLSVDQQTSSPGNSSVNGKNSNRPKPASNQFRFGRQKSMGVILPSKSIFHKKDNEGQIGECSKIGERVVYPDTKYLLVNSNKNTVLRNDSKQSVSRAIQQRLNNSPKRNPASDLLWSKFNIRSREKSASDIKAVNVLKKKILSFSFKNGLSAVIKSKVQNDLLTPSLAVLEVKESAVNYNFKSHSRNSSSNLVLAPRSELTKSREGTAG